MLKYEEHILSRPAIFDYFNNEYQDSLVNRCSCTIRITVE
jgi:hypothetical protein